MQAKPAKSKPAKPAITGLRHGGTIKLAAEKKPTKEELKKDPGLVMANIVKQQRTLYSKNMSDWIAARAQAENPIYPMRTLLYDIYEDAILDNFIHGLIYNHRVLPIKNKVFNIKNKADKADPIKTAFFKKGWFMDLRTWYMEAKAAYGFSLPYMEEMEFDGKTSWIKKLTLLERKNVHPQSHIIAKYQTDLEGLDYTTDPIYKYVLPCGDSDDLGLLNKAVPMYILKKHGWQNWDEFGELFGMPIRTVKTASQDPRVISEIEGWLKDMSTAAYGIFPDSTELDIKESKHTDAYKVFAEIIKMANEELAILFCGQTMTTMDGSSRSQAEVHQAVQDEITKDDEESFKTWVNEFLIPLLRDKHNYPFDDGDYFEWYQAEDLQALLKLYIGINNMGFQLDAADVTEKFGVKITGIKQVTPAAEPKDEESFDDDDSNLSADKRILKLHAKLQDLYYGRTV